METTTKINDYVLVADCYDKDDPLRPFWGRISSRVSAIYWANINKTDYPLGLKFKNGQFYVYKVGDYLDARGRKITNLCSAAVLSMILSAQSIGSFVFTGLKGIPYKELTE
jgi:hypothetical protein